MTKRMNTVIALVGLACAACAGGDAEENGATGRTLSGSIEADGSSTVYPITEAVAEEFGREHGGSVRVTVGVSGTGGGFRRFCAGETAISNASRPIKPQEEQDCAANNVAFTRFDVALDGITVAVSPSNTFAECLTVDELKRVWEPGSTMSNWSQVRQGFPNQPLKLYGAGTSSGTFDYFTEAVMGEEDASRADYTASEDDNVLVQGVEGDPDALGYFGFAYYEENKERLKALAVDNGSGCVLPSIESIRTGQYAPLARPIFIYVNNSALERPEVAAFVRFYMEHGGELAGQVGYVPLDSARYQEQMNQLPQTTSDAS